MRGMRVVHRILHSYAHPISQQRLLHVHVGRVARNGVLGLTRRSERLGTLLEDLKYCQLHALHNHHQERLDLPIRFWLLMG